MTVVELKTSDLLVSETTSETASETTCVREDPLIELRSGLAARVIDGELVRAARADRIVKRTLAFYLDELLETGKYRELGYSSVLQYAEQRLGMGPRRARESCRAGRVLAERERIDQAFLDGVLGWTKTEMLTHGVREHEQEEWIERAKRASCSELKALLARHRRGLSLGEGAGGGAGLTRSEIDVQGKVSPARYAKLEKIRDDLMRKRGVRIDDGELLSYLLDAHKLVETDPVKEAEKAVACEHDETPDWLRGLVLARDGHRCGACGGAENLHVHHVKFRCMGGLTQERNLTTMCTSCHGLIHEGKLLARVVGDGAVEFENGFGERIGVVGAAGALLSGGILRVLREEAKPLESARSPVWIRDRWTLTTRTFRART